MFTLTVFSLVLSPLQNAISRFYERQCDRYALVAHEQPRRRTAPPSGNWPASTKPTPSPTGSKCFLLHSHPPITERLAMADG